MAGNQDTSAEEWRAIPDLCAYQASSLGRIRSLDRYLTFNGRWGETTRFHRGRILRIKPKPNGSGSIYFVFYADGGKYEHVNRAVCAAFHGRPPSEEHEAAHLNGNSTNNVPGNLAWATPKENAEHKIIHGTAPIGSQNGASKLSENEVKEIIERYAGGESSLDLSIQFSITKGAVTAIIRGYTWKHINSAFREKAIAIAKQNIRLAAARTNQRRADAARQRKANAETVTV